MKPLTLTLTGFRSYPTPVTVDFTGKSLVAALGDTGAGKSSLLDAVTFALFRKSSWDAKEPRQLIADGAQAMSVELTFLHDGQRWHVHRTMHATNQNAGRHHLKNLDTGEEIDNATPVDDRIKAVLQMGYDTFLRIGLLPQGKFDRLLTAPPKERSERLRELFGAESLESIQQMAARQREKLKDLLGEAKAKRDLMPGNPGQTAEEAGAAAGRAAARAEHLNSAIDRITGLQKEVAAARTAAEETANAENLLATRAVADAGALLDALESVAAGIVARRDDLNRRAAQAATRESALSAAITAAEAAGEGPGALTRAAMVLETLAADAEEHRRERDRLTKATRQLADEHEAIGKTDAELAERVAQAEPLAEAARAATETSKQIRARAATARTSLSEALSAARRVADTASVRTAAARRHASAKNDLGVAEAGVDAANKNLTAAETRLETLQLRDKAAAIAAELHSGDDCPVCHQQIPANFQPVSATDAAELAVAKKQLNEAKASRRTAGERLTAARAGVSAADEMVRERETDHDTAQQNAQDATAQAVRAFEDLAALAVGTGQGFDAESASVMFTATTTALAIPTAGSAAPPMQHPEHDAALISDAIAACEQAADLLAEKLQTEGHRRTAQIEADRKTLAERKNAQQRAADGIATAAERHTRAVAKTDARVGTLPSRIRAMLPDDAIDVVDGEAAAAAITARQAEVQELFDQRENARADKTAISDAQRTLDHDAHVQLERPLNKLRDNLVTWAQAATQVAAHLDEAHQHQVPIAPTQWGLAEARHYAAELSTITLTLGAKLTERATAATDRAAAAESNLDEYAAALADVDGFDAAAGLATPQALHPLVAAAAHEAKEAKDQRRNQREAQNLIKPAADLDFAIAAGKARYEALEVLRRELVDARFLGHLTLLRTRALLSVASDLLGQMSDGRFGFADSFDIASRSSGVVHPPNRLSGGEKFQASLALALALAELHSRSGPALGSLFLDEGFAALDTTALDSALEVLRTRVGGGRLVMVISHLHAVAEAVDHVLWVERTTAGSSARWLTPAQRDELAQADLARGLQALAL